MQHFDESTIEFADFAFERQKVACYGLQNNGGGATTVLNFPSKSLADDFHDSFLKNRHFNVFRNEAQIICLTGFERVMRLSNDDPRIRHLKYNRNFMMGTLEHLV